MTTDPTPIAADTYVSGGVEDLVARLRYGQTSTDMAVYGDMEVNFGNICREAADMIERLAATPVPANAEGDSARDRLLAAIERYIASAGVPLTEFNPEFVIRMIGAMMVSFHKYGRVADAYPVKFDAASDVRARMKKYRETGNKHYLVDAANFAMIEAMHSSRSDAMWGSNDAADSPGRTTASGHQLVQEDNAGNRIMGETILHIPGDDA